MLTQTPYDRHPKFHVATDYVILGYDSEELQLLMYPRSFEPSAGKWSLMGGFLQEDESSDAAAVRVLYETVGMKDIYLEQIGAFADPKRDLGGRVISIGYYALIRLDAHDKDKVREHGAHWWPLSKLPEMVFDHHEIVEKALVRLRRKAGTELIGKELLPEMFTLTQLNQLYNAIFERQFDAGNFRKKIASLGRLEKLPIKDVSSSKRGAYYYKFSETEDTPSFDRIVRITE